MDDSETSVWLQAMESYGQDALRIRVRDAVGSYKRAPGLGSRARLYASSIGELATQMLWEVIQESGLAFDTIDDPSQFVSMRLGLRVHLHQTLQSQLLQDGFASECLQEDYLARELGL